MSTTPSLQAAAPFDGIRQIALADVPVGWRRLPLLMFGVAPMSFFIGLGPALMWLAASWCLEGATFIMCRKVAAGEDQWRRAYIAIALMLPWCWIIYSVLLWFTGIEAAKIFSLCSLFATAAYPVLSNYHDKRLMTGLVLPPLVTLFLMMASLVITTMPWWVIPFAMLSALGMNAVIVEAATIMHNVNRDLRGAQAALQAERDALDERVRERTAELALATERAEAASKAKSQFIANMSHELRTPLNAVIGYAEILIDDLTDNKTATADAQRIQAAGRHLLGMVNDILDLAKADTTELKVKLEIVDVPATVKEAVEAARPLAAAKRNKMELFIYDGVEPIECDPVRLGQAVKNLISNACKFTAEGMITIAVGLEDENWLAIKVRDTGAGIAPDQMMRLFQPFSMGDGSTTRETGGAGLGLITTRNFARMLGGDVLVQSKPGVGSQFTLRLPTARRERVAA